MLTIGDFNSFWGFLYRVSQKKGYPLMSSASAACLNLNALMSPGVRKTLELGIFMLTLRINLRILGLTGDLKHSNLNMRQSAALQTVAFFWDNL